MTPAEIVRRRAALAGMHSRVWLGSMGATGLALLALGLGALIWAPRLAEDAVVLHERYEAEGAAFRERLNQRAPDPSTSMQEFHDGFPDAGQHLADLRLIFRIAREQQVQLTHGDYAAARRPNVGLTAFEVVLPVKTSYAALRAFVAAVLNALPNASLAELRLERAGGSQLDARIHLTLYYRET